MERSFWSTIRGKLLVRMLLVALLPMAVIGAVAIASLQSLSGTADDSLASAQLALSDEVVGTRVAGVSDQIARELASFLDERVSDVQGWSTDVGFGNAARAATGRANVMGLPEMRIGELEARFADEPRLGDVHVERDLLTAIDNSPSFKDVFITDQHGFIVDYSTPTNDFVQSDEDWWIETMADGLHISEPEFDAVAGVFVVDISVRVADDGDDIGVLRASLDMNVVQIVADRFAGGTDSFDVSIVDPIGRFLAETSTNHQPSHIMSAAFVATNPTVSSEFVREVFAQDANELHADGHSITEQGVAGFAHVGDALAARRGDMGTELTAFDWTVVVEQPAEVAFAGLAPLEGLTNEVSSTSSNLMLVLLLVAVFGAIAAGAMALIIGARIAQPIARLRDAVAEAAQVTLPNVVAQIDRLEADEELPELEPFTLDTGDEVEDLADSFNTVQQTAADLAADQARLRRTNVATTFVNLGRRNQNLLSRQLEHINSMEERETNSDMLQRLFELDHLATRMRRNAESLLVLAGEDTPRRFRQPVSVHKVMQAAGAEIEDFTRVELTSLDEASVEGSAASDIAHLVAELLENASTFSPPGSLIQVHGRQKADSYLLAIVDQGIGMEEDDLHAANARLADPAEFDRAPSAFLGHFVVGQLAKRHGIRVRVADSPYGGLTAQLQLPASILTSLKSPEPVAEPTQAETLPEFTAEMAEPTPTKLSEAEQAELAGLERSLLADAPMPAPPAPEPPTAPTQEPVAPKTATAKAPPKASGPKAVASKTASPTTATPKTVAPETVAPNTATPKTVAPNTATPKTVAPPEPVPVVPTPAPTATVPPTPVRTPAPAPAPPAAPTTEQPQPQPQLMPSHPASEFAATAVAIDTLNVQAGLAAPPVQTTPSGFRRRVRGQEGAPQAAAKVERKTPTPPRRTPEEVQESLQRFRRGVETGRAKANAEIQNENSVTEGDNQ